MLNEELGNTEGVRSYCRGFRIRVNQAAAASGEVVSSLNISNARVEDGGEYECRARNSVGEASHTARLNIYGGCPFQSHG